MADIRIALQLYSVREQCEEDLPGVIQSVAEMGYDGVEFAGYYDYSADDLRQMLADNDLQCCGSHLRIDLFSGDNLQQTIDFNKTLGNPYLIVPGLPEEYTDSRDAWLKTADLFNELSAKVRAQDCWIGYHNHHTEFTELDGQMPWDTFFGNTVDDVLMQLDTGNALRGGAHVAQFIERYPGRATTVHLKEYSETDEKALIGEGDIQWDQIFELCETVGDTQWYIVEQESYAYPPMECVERCLDSLREMGR